MKFEQDQGSEIRSLCLQVVKNAPGQWPSAPRSLGSRTYHPAGGMEPSMLADEWRNLRTVLGSPVPAISLDLSEIELPR